MAAKHDGKHARANMWVTHQNLARAKGGRPHHQFKERKVPKPAPKPSPLAAGEEKKPAAAVDAAEETTPASAETGSAAGTGAVASKE